MTEEMYEDLLERNKLQISELNTLTEEQDKHIVELEKQNKELQEENIKLHKVCHKWFKRWRETKKSEIELLAQIEKIKCCGNCKHHRYNYGELECVTKGCKNKSKWEIKEK